MDIMPNVHFNKGEVIFEEGYPAVAVYLVCEGSVEIFKKKGDSFTSLAKLEKNSIFGEMAFISDRPRSATVIAGNDTWCYYLNKDVFVQRLEDIDNKISLVFNDLVDTIREQSNNAVGDNPEELKAPTDEMELEQKKIAKIIPAHSYEYVTKDKELISKVEDMDFFMKKLYFSLVEIAFKKVR